MKFIKRFESKSITFDSSWNGFSDFGTNYWTKPLSKKGFTCIIVERLKNYICYLKPEYKSPIFMDYLGSDRVIFRHINNIDIDDAYDLCERQLDYFEQLKKFPTKIEIDNCLYPFTDQDVYLFSEPTYGYLSKGGMTTNFHRTYPDMKFGCILIFDNWSISLKESDIIEYLNEFKILIEDITNNEYDIEYHNDSEEGLIIIITI